MLIELGYKISVPLPICDDNQGAIFVASNPVTERRTKHIDIRYHFVRELIEEGKIEVLYIPGEHNPADMFTKSLARVKFEYFRGMLGLKFA